MIIFLGDNDYILGDTDYILGDNHNNFYDTENILVIQMGDKLVTKWVTHFFSLNNPDIFFFFFLLIIAE